MFKSFTKFHFILISLTFFLYVNNLSAQSVTIRGSVIDAVTKDPLPGANIILMGTSIGAASDNEGKFIIRNIPAGSYNIKASYVGYESSDLKVSLKNGGTFNTEFKLNPVGIKGQTVTVTAQASGQNEAINQQLSSVQIKNVVSLARIRELPDANAAESVARLPGVSIIRQGGEGAEVVVRGLSPQYNQITIDGMQLPGNVVSADPNSQSTFTGGRGTNLSMISSSMLGGIEVIKAITPDMDAAVLGGVVNFALRTAEKNKANRPTFEIQTQGGYEALKNVYNNYLLVGSFEQRYFGQSLGLFLQGSTERRNLSANQLGVNYFLNDKTHGDLGIPDLVSMALTDVYRIRKRNDVTAVLDYENSQTQLKFMNFFSESDTKPITRSESISPSANDMFYSALDSETKLNTIANLLSIKQDIPIFHIDAKFSHTYSESRNPYDLSFTFWQQNAGLSGLGNISKLSPQALESLAKPDETIARLETIKQSSNFVRNRALTAAVDLQTESLVSNLFTAKLKFGGMYQYRKRSYDFNYGVGPNISLGGGNTVSRILQAYPNMQTYGSSVTVTNFIDPSYSFGNFLDGKYSINYPINVDFMRTIYNLVRVGASPESFQNNKQESIIYDYHGTEKKSAAYIMATVNVGGLFTILPGVRYQNLTTSYFAYRTEQIPGGYKYKDTTVTKPNGYWLPMVHLIYKPFGWLQVHFAYTNTLNYPDFNTIVPRYNIGQASIMYNNYNLKTATSENYDLVVSAYNNEIGLFTIDGFKKRIENLVFPSTIYIKDLSAYPDLPQNRSQTYEFSTFVNNSRPIDVWGIETDWQTHFWYLPEPFSWIVFNVNYTHIFSQATYPKSELNIVYNPDGTFTKTILDTFYTTRLLNQPNDIMNFAVGIDYKGFSGRLSLLYQDNVFKKPDFWMQNRVNSAKYVRWDLSLRQELPWYGIQLFLNLNNISGEDDTDINQKTGFPVNIQKYGMTSDLGLRVKI